MSAILNFWGPLLRIFLQWEVYCYLINLTIHLTLFPMPVFLNILKSLCIILRKFITMFDSCVITGKIHCILCQLCAFILFISFWVLCVSCISLSSGQDRVETPKKLIDSFLLGFKPRLKMLIVLKFYPLFCRSLNLHWFS